MENPIVKFEMEDGKSFSAELFPEVAENTVNNFISLVKSGFYDGLIFHRVIKDFMIQGGDPEGSGMGGPGYSIKGEFSHNGYENNLKHDKGVLSMARSFMPDSAGSQFFIMHKKSPHLDGEYATFGKVIQGIEVIDQIAEVKTDMNDKPLEDVKIKKITVDTKDYDYKEVEKI
ncbi:peptidylprolyl isomerase [Anaerococcus sp. AGMB00486]|uniref:Peptidyl-prolyl cis-trans isomerase n=2 Tax=Anaerococcus TaxID=165779 RepID=A0ABX2N9S0_9FIRM|nr:MULTISPECIES: peptidylprolyl isomerase [Anaerococcus]MDY3006826.1 peptidylprolyl isomerase [Anaerococcus porci]MSS78281.1 peptidylprolyl isomerase [Anaerococcus porci]NVF11395.1 peptidylprolyl isomerase [Anaerococcus faecalis]